MAAGAVTSAYIDYKGPVLAQDALEYLLVRFFRSTGTLNLRVNGVYEQTLQNNDLKTATLAAELAFGLYWDIAAAATKHRAPRLLKAFGEFRFDRRRPDDCGGPSCSRGEHRS